MIKIAVLKETAIGETRVAASAETVKKLIARWVRLSRLRQGQGAVLRLQMQIMWLLARAWERLLHR
jgi:NAD/NADP transhydrogenase alpha subunit